MAELMEQLSALGRAPPELLAELAPPGAPPGAPLPGMENCVLM